MLVAWPLRWSPTIVAEESGTWRMQPMYPTHARLMRRSGMLMGMAITRGRGASITTWADQTHPIGIPFPGDPRAFEKNNFAVAELDPLGRKLLGLDPWS